MSTLKSKLTFKKISTDVSRVDAMANAGADIHEIDYMDNTLLHFGKTGPSKIHKRDYKCESPIRRTCYHLSCILFSMF